MWKKQAKQRWFPIRIWRGSLAFRPAPCRAAPHCRRPLERVLPASITFYQIQVLDLRVGSSLSVRLLPICSHVKIPDGPTADGCVTWRESCVNAWKRRGKLVFLLAFPGRCELNTFVFHGLGWFFVITVHNFMHMVTVWGLAVEF